MSAAVRLLAFALVLAAAFAAAAGLGRSVGPFERSIGVHEEAMEDADHADDPEPHAEGAAGLSVEQDGLRLVASRTSFDAGARTELSFAVVGEDGRPLEAYDVTHERRMHLIVVRRDLGHFVHVHPEQRPDGWWQVELRLPDAGAYRAFADFSSEGEKRTLGLDLLAYGEAPPAPPAPAPTRAAEAGPYRVALQPETRRPGEETALRFEVTRDGRAVAVDRYLGARGHLVLLREGDLAYLHTHAEEDVLEFEATFPSAGTYRAFLQFRSGGSVHTAELALEVGQP